MRLAFLPLCLVVAAASAFRWTYWIFQSNAPCAHLRCSFAASKSYVRHGAPRHPASRGKTGGRLSLSLPLCVCCKLYHKETIIAEREKRPFGEADRSSAEYCCRLFCFHRLFCWRWERSDPSAQRTVRAGRMASKSNCRRFSWCQSRVMSQDKIHQPNAHWFLVCGLVEMRAAAVKWHLPFGILASFISIVTYKVSIGVGDLD